MSAVRKVIDGLHDDVRYLTRVARGTAGLLILERVERRLLEKLRIAEDRAANVSRANARVGAYSAANAWREEAEQLRSQTIVLAVCRDNVIREMLDRQPFTRHSTDYALLIDQ